MTQLKTIYDDKKLLALRMIRARLGGEIGENLTVHDCIELMLQYAEFESARADVATKLAHDLAHATPMPPILIPRGKP